MGQNAALHAHGFPGSFKPSRLTGQRPGQESEPVSSLDLLRAASWGQVTSFSLPQSQLSNLGIVGLVLQRTDCNAPNMAFGKNHGPRQLGISLNVCHTNQWLDKGVLLRALKAFSPTLKGQSKAKFSNQKLEILIYCRRTSWKISLRDTWTF